MEANLYRKKRSKKKKKKKKKKRGRKDSWEWRRKRDRERERERESRGIYDGGSAYVSTHYGVHGIKEAAFTTSHIPFTASEI